MKPQFKILEQLMKFFICISFFFYSQYSFGQKIEISCRVDTSKKDYSKIYYGFNSEFGEVIVPPSFRRLDFKSDGVIIADETHLFNDKGIEKLKKLNSNIRVAGSIYIKYHSFEVGVYRRDIDKEIYHSRSREINLCNLVRDYEWKVGKDFNIKYDSLSCYLIDNNFNRVDFPEFKDGCFINNEYFVIEGEDGEKKIYSTNKDLIYSTYENITLELKGEYIIIRGKYSNLTKAFSLKSKTICSFSYLVFCESEYIGITRRDSLFVLKNNLMVQSSLMLDEPITYGRLHNIDPLLFTLNDNLFFQDKMIAEKIFDVTYFNSNGMILVESRKQTLLFYNGIEIAKDTVKKTATYMGKYMAYYDKNFDCKYCNCVLFTEDGKRLNSETFDDLDLIYDEKLFIVSKKGKYGIIDYDGNQIVDYKYDHIFKNTSLICETPFTFFVKRKGQKSYETLNLKGLVPLIKNVYFKAEGEKRNEIQGGIVFGAPAPRMDVKKEHYSAYQNDGFLTYKGWFHSNKNSDEKFYLNSNSNTLELRFQPLYGYYSLFDGVKNKEITNSRYVVLKKDIVNHRAKLLKVSKPKYSSNNYFLSFDSNVDSSGIIDGDGNWVLGPNVAFNYQILDDNLLEKDSVLYNFSKGKLKPIGSYQYLKYPFVKFIESDYYVMLDNAGNIVLDKILEVFKDQIHSDYHLVSLKEKQSHLLSNNGKLFLDLQHYKFEKKIDEYGFIFKSTIDTTMLWIDLDLKVRGRYQKIIWLRSSGLFAWDKFSIYSFSSPIRDPVLYPIELLRYMNTNKFAFSFRDIGKYIRLDDNNRIVIWNRDINKTSHIFEDVISFKVHEITAEFAFVEMKKTDFKNYYYRWNLLTNQIEEHRQ